MDVGEHRHLRVPAGAHDRPSDAGNSGPGTAGPFFNSGTVFKSMDGGATWNPSGAGLPDPSGFFTPVSSIVSLAINPTAPNELYAAAYGFGIYKSMDAGRTWNAANTGLSDLNARVVRLDPAVPTTVYVATDFGVVKSTNGGADWNPASGGLPPAALLTALAVDPGRTNVVYAGTQRAGAFRSTNGGTT